VRQAFHACIRQSVVPSTARTTPRKVHLNTWEAVGFRMSADALGALVRDAAALGVERFVLDDGWFLGRRDDTTSLGDWVPDPVLFPEGLQPLIREVQAAGMDFGLWVEPEMVSPQSELLRAHPDWCLHLPGHAQPTQRHQLVLDLTRPEVGEHLFGRLDTLLGENDIAYLKWDHNRELFPRAGKGHAQVLALYALLERLRAAHPDVEIESCASGGARVDAGILRHTARMWASDNNDPIERLRINRGWFQFLPGSVTGNHVGPSPNHVTGRRTEMDFRAKVAMFGHMGVEADPSRMTAEERATLAAHIALYKEWRDVLHAGQLFAVETGSPSLHGWFAWDGARGLALLAQTAMADDYDVPPLRLPALDPEGRYRLHLPEPWPHKAARYLAHAEQWREGIDLGGRVITERGLALPLAHPETAWLIAVETL
jgi:alpha-galactosidase